MICLAFAITPALAILFGGLRGLATRLWILAAEVAWPAYFGRRHLDSLLGVSFAASFVSAAVGPLPFGLVYDAFGSYDYAIGGWRFSRLQRRGRRSLPRLRRRRGRGTLARDHAKSGLPARSGHCGESQGQAVLDPWPITGRHRLQRDDYHYVALRGRSPADLALDPDSATTATVEENITAGNPLSAAHRERGLRVQGGYPAPSARRSPEVGMRQEWEIPAFATI